MGLFYSFIFFHWSNSLTPASSQQTETHHFWLNFQNKGMLLNRFGSTLRMRSPVCFYRLALLRLVHKVWTHCVLDRCCFHPQLCLKPQYIHWCGLNKSDSQKTQCRVTYKKWALSRFYVLTLLLIIPKMYTL